MRVVSDFKDFYDVGMSTGQDLTLVYRRYRKEVETEVDIPYFSFSHPRRSRWDKYKVSDGFWFAMTAIGFCGKLYPVFEVNLPKHKGAKSKEERETRKFCFSLDDIDSYVRNYFKEDEYDGWRAKGYVKYNPWPWEYRRHVFEKFFEKYKIDKIDKVVNIFEEYQSPAFSMRLEKQKDGNWKKWVVLNCCLKEFEFYRMFDPNQAFQEISMFLGNIAEPRKPIPEIDDETLCEAKGFDLKFSFRKPKSEKNGRK